MKKLILMVLSAIALTTILVGCGATADESKPIPEVKAEAQKMDTAALQKQIDAYKQAIADKTTELGKIKEEIKEIPFSEMFGDKAKELKGKLSEISTSIDKLDERLEIYVDQLKEK